MRAIGEICCGDCACQHATYSELLVLDRYVGLDLDPVIVAANRKRGIECLRGDTLDATVMRSFLACDVLFFGLPLSQNCDGHSLLSFRGTAPGYDDFCALLYGRLGYTGTIVCIAPKQTRLGDVQWLHSQVTRHTLAVNLPLIHWNHATVTGGGEATLPRLKYVGIWLSPRLENRWAQRSSMG